MFFGIKMYILLLLQTFIVAHLVGLAISHHDGFSRPSQPCKSNEECKSLDQCPHLYAAYNSSVDAKNIISNERTCVDTTKTGQSDLFCCPKPKNFLPINACGSRGNRTNGRMAGLNEFPWMALLLYWNSSTEDWEPKCGGSLINNWFVLTAAHCVTFPGLPEIEAPKRVRLGEYNTATDPDVVIMNGKRSYAPHYVERNVDMVVVHGEFFHGTEYRNDIALLRLQIPVRYSHAINPICLPDLSQNTSYNHSFEAAGWGNNSPVLRRIFLQERHPTNPKCKEAKAFNTATQICAGGDEVGNVAGDSGGPLMATMKWKSKNVTYLAGIISYGFAQSPVKNQPSFYTRTREYIPWIDSFFNSKWHSKPERSLMALTNKCLRKLIIRTQSQKINLKNLENGATFQYTIKYKNNNPLTLRFIKKFKIEDFICI